MFLRNIRVLGATVNSRTGFELALAPGLHHQLERECTRVAVRRPGSDVMETKRHL